MKKERLHHLDALKAFAMIGGIFFHAALPYMSVKAPDWFLSDSQNGSQIFDVFVWLMHRVRIPLFFVLSGFFSALVIEKKGFSYFMKRRFQKILIPFLLALFIIIPIMAELYNSIDPSCTKSFWGSLCSFSFFNIYSFKNISQIKPAHLWFLYYLFFYCLMSWGLNIISKKIKFKTIILFILLSLVHFFMNNIMSINKTSSFKIDPMAFLYFLLFYQWGMSLFHHDIHKKMPQKNNLFLAIVGALSSLSLFLMIKKNIVSSLSLVEVLICAGTSLYAIFSIKFLISWAQKKFPFKNSIIEYYTDASYWIYLWHIIPIVVFQAILFPLPWHIMIKYLITSLGSFVFLSLFYQIAAKNNFIGVWLGNKNK